MVQVFLFFLVFLLSFVVFLSGYYCNFSYFFALDNLSAFLVLLRVWVGALMVTASEGVYRSGYFSV